MKSDRLRFERLHPDDVDPYDLYEHVRRGPPHIEEITRYVQWEPYDHPKEAVDWIENCGEDFENGEPRNSVRYSISREEWEDNRE